MTTAHVPDFLLHDEGDTVAIATRDLSPGSVEGGYLVGPISETVELTEPVPLGHKFAIRDITQGKEVIEYGVCVGVAATAITTGQHVHVHNVRSVRWQSSIAS